MRAVIAIATAPVGDSPRPGPAPAADQQPCTENGSYAFSIFADHPGGHRVTQLDPIAIRPQHPPIRSLAPAEKFGASTRKVWAHMGYCEAHIHMLLANNTVSEAWSGE